MMGPTTGLKGQENLWVSLAFHIPCCDFVPVYFETFLFTGKERWNSVLNVRSRFVIIKLNVHAQRHPALLGYAAMEKIIKERIQRG